MQVERGSNCSLTSQTNPNLKPGNTEALGSVTGPAESSASRCYFSPRCFSLPMHSPKTEMHSEGSAVPWHSPRGQAVAPLPRSQQAGTPAAGQQRGSPRAVTRAGGGSAQTAPRPRRQLQPSSRRKAQCSRSANTRPFGAGSPGLRSAGAAVAEPARRRPGASPGRPHTQPRLPEGPRISGPTPAAHPGPGAEPSRGNPPGRRHRLARRQRGRAPCPRPQPPLTGAAAGPSGPAEIGGDGGGAAPPRPRGRRGPGRRRGGGGARLCLSWGWAGFQLTEQDATEFIN